MVRSASLAIGRRELKAARSYAVQAREVVPADFVLMPGLESVHDEALKQVEADDNLKRMRDRMAAEVAADTKP
jgi:hypothetical protein